MQTENILNMAELLRVVVISSSKSCWMPVSIGGPQRSVLGPILGNISTKDRCDRTEHTLSEPKGPQQARETGISQSSAKISAKSYTREE